VGVHSWYPWKALDEYGVHQSDCINLRLIMQELLKFEYFFFVIEDSTKLTNYLLREIILCKKVH